LFRQFGDCKNYRQTKLIEKDLEWLRNNRDELSHATRTVTCWGDQLGEIFTFIFLAVVLFEDTKTHFTFHTTCRQETLLV